MSIGNFKSFALITNYFLTFQNWGKKKKKLQAIEKQAVTTLGL